MEGFRPENLPIGSGQKIIKEREKLTLPAESIKNTVVWVNPAFPEAPYKLEQGKPTELAVFFTPSPGKESKNLKISPEELEGRSGLLGSIIFRDKNGIPYRDLDLKGVGYFKAIEETINKHKKIYEVAETKVIEPSVTAGIMDYGRALYDRNMSEKFIKAGIRVHRVLTITKLKEIIDGRGQKVSIAEARKKNLISEKVDPVIEIRAFGTKNRIEDLGVPGMGRKFLENAKAMVVQELGKDPKNFSTEDYLRWFAKTLAEQIVKMIKLGYYQTMFVHNITLDCRLVDLDSVDNIKNITKKTGLSIEDLPAKLASVGAIFLQTLVGKVYSFEKVDTHRMIKICHQIYKKSYGGEVTFEKIILTAKGYKKQEYKYPWQF